MHPGCLGLLFVHGPSCRKTFILKIRVGKPPGTLPKAARRIISDEVGEIVGAKRGEFVTRDRFMEILRAARCEQFEKRGGMSVTEFRSALKQWLRRKPEVLHAQLEKIASQHGFGVITPPYCPKFQSNELLWRDTKKMLLVSGFLNTVLTVRQRI